MIPEVAEVLEEEENVCYICVQSWFYAALLYLPTSLVRITSVSRHMNGLCTALNCRALDCNEKHKISAWCRMDVRRKRKRRRKDEVSGWLILFCII